MGEPPPFDPCECIFSPHGAMRRLISLLRISQTTCTDEQCFGTLPGPSRDDTGMNMMYIMMAWMFLAFMLYLFRPSSLREGGNKPAPHDDRHDDPPAAPPVM